MNHVYRLKRSGRSQQLQPVPETARTNGKGTRAGSTQAQVVTAMLVSVALGGMASAAQAQQAPPAATQLPQGGVVTRGAANIVTNIGANNALMNVNQSSQRAVIDWTSFNVGSQSKVQFNQPSSNAVVLNNILGNNASQIYGQISANGQVFLSNPNGVYFSPTAQVNVGGLVATTGKANADDFMAGKFSFSREGSTGSVVNEGQLRSALGGYIALLAPEVRNQGVVVAQAGTIALASGEAITLNFNSSGTGLAGITTTPQAIAALVDNRSAVLAEGGQIILSAHALAALQGSVVKNSGQLSATSLTEKGGKIVLMADRIELTSTSRIDSNGPMGGGTVLVGGDWQGSGDMRQATQVTMTQGASIEANATQQGDGGKVVLWSDVKNANSLTQVEGRIEAKGAGAGNGGQVETSGHALQVGDLALSTKATGSGTNGEWLLDPSDVTISSGTNSNQNYSSSTFTPTASSATSVVNTATLQGVLDASSTTITVTTTNTAPAGAGTGNITVGSTLTWTSTSKLILLATGGLTGSGNIVTGAAGSNLTINQTGTSSYSGAISGSGSLTKLGAGALTLSGANTYTGGTTVSAGTLALGASNVLPSAGAITVSGSGATLSLGAYSNSVGAVSIGTGGGSITSTTGVLTGTGYTFSNTSVAIVSASLAGSGAVTQNGSSQTTLSGANTYTGGTTVSAGTLALGANNALPSTGAITVSGGTLSLGAYNNSVGAVSIGSSGGSITSTTGVLTGTGYTFSNTSAAATVSAILAGSGSVTQSGTNTTTLSGANTYTGGTNFNSGKLVANSVGAFGTSGTLSFGGGTLVYASATQSTDFSTRFSTAANQAYSVETNFSINWGTSLTSTGASLAKLGTGRLSLGGANSLSGGIAVNAGALIVGNADALGSGSIVVSSGATLDLGGLTVNTGNPLSIAGSGLAGYLASGQSGALVNSASAAVASFNGLLTLTGNTTIAATASPTSGIRLTHTGAITGAYDLTFANGNNNALSSVNSIIATQSGKVTVNGGIWTFTGNNTYAGGTTITSGALYISSDSNLGAVPSSPTVNLTFNGTGSLTFTDLARVCRTP